MFSMRDVKIVHFIPGRLRLRVKQLKNDPEFSARVKDEIEAVPGIIQVEINELTGSVLLKYEKEALDSDTSVNSMLETLERLFPELDLQPARDWLAERNH